MSKVINEFENFTHYVDSIDEELLSVAVGEGKWTVGEVITHLTNWDKYSIENMVPYMKDNAKLPEFIDHDTHNKAVADMVKNYRDSIALKNDFRETRLKLISMLKEIGPDISFTIGNGKRKLSIDSYSNIFVRHDRHHRKQIEKLRF